MKLMMFYDLENFKKSFREDYSDRFLDVGKAQFFFMSFIKNVLKWECPNGSLIRVYAYTGEYTKRIIQRIENDMDTTGSDDKKEKYRSLLEKTKNGFGKQQNEFNHMKKYNFFELKHFPLKYEKGQIFQKGVDVQLAVDVVSNAFLDNFDTAIVCSGDIDLLGSIRCVKNLGKKVIIASHPNLLSQELRKEADYFIDLSILRTDDLDMFSHIYKPNIPPHSKS